LGWDIKEGRSFTSTNTPILNATLQGPYVPPEFSTMPVDGEPVGIMLMRPMDETISSMLPWDLVF
jgi:hypothetical protein